VQKHKQALADTIALVAAGPQTSPFMQHVGATSDTAANCLIDSEIYFDDSRSSVFSCDVADGDDLSKEDDSCLIGHVMKRIFNGGFGSRGLPVDQRTD
jgi:hypothetical protein